MPSVIAVERNSAPGLKMLIVTCAVLCRPPPLFIAITSTRSTANTIAATATMNNISMWRVCLRARSCCSKKFIVALLFSVRDSCPIRPCVLRRF